MRELLLNDTLSAIQDGDYLEELAVQVDNERWCNAEPDVGISQDWPDDWDEEFYIDRVPVGSRAEQFAEALVKQTKAFGEDTTMIAKHVREAVEEWSKDWERE